MADEAPKTVVREGAVLDPRDPAPEVVTMPWWQMIGVRVLRVYLQSLLGFLTAAGTGAAAAVGVTMPAGDFWVLLIACASLAVAPAVMSLLTNTIEILNGWDVRRPTLRA